MNCRKEIVKVALSLVLIMSVILISTDNILKVKYTDGIYGMSRFYELDENTVDVLFLGSSHAFETFNTEVLWDDYGISSFVLGGSMQPMWNTYYYLKEALKTQNPKLIVLEGYGCVFDNNTSDYSTQIKNCYGMNFSLNKIEAMIASTSWDNPKFFLPVSNYSSRYNELTKEDFLKPSKTKYKYWMGFGSNYSQIPFSNLIAENDGVAINMSPKTEKYYKKILDLAIDLQIPLLVVISPYPAISEYDIGKYNNAIKVAEENGIQFMNLAVNPAELGINYEEHAADGGHLNVFGNKLVSAFIGDYIKQNYQIEDHRGDERYICWDKCSLYLKHLDFINMPSDNKDIYSVLDVIKEKNYYVLVVKGKRAKKSEILINYLRENINPNVLEIEKKTSYKDIYLLFNSDLVYSERNKLGIEYDSIDNGVSLLVYDTITEDIYDVFSISDIEIESLVENNNIDN